MAKDKQPKQASGQQSMFGKKRGFFSFLKNKATVVKDKSNSEVTVFSANDKEYSVETSHGRCKRYQEEIESKTHSITKKPLSDADIAYRKGVVQTMGAQAGAWKKKHGN